MKPLLSDLVRMQIALLDVLVWAESEGPYARLKLISALGLLSLPLFEQSTLSQLSLRQTHSMT
jgi:hypothetical protein